MEEPVLSSKLFNDRTEVIKSEVYSEIQNKALVDMSKKTSGGKRFQPQSQRSRLEEEEEGTCQAWWMDKSQVSQQSQGVPPLSSRQEEIYRPR